MSERLSLRELMVLALLLSLSLMLFWLESLIPVPILPPGAKLGLSNLVTLVALYYLGERPALLVLLMRVGLGSMLGGGLMVLLYSLFGALLSFTAMCALRRTGLFSIVAVSAAGGFSHNVGQLIAAALVTGSPSIFTYLTALGPAGLATGLTLGLLAALVLRRLPRNKT